MRRRSEVGFLRGLLLLDALAATACLTMGALVVSLVSVAVTVLLQAPMPLPIGLALLLAVLVMAGLMRRPGAQQGRRHR